MTYPGHPVGPPVIYHPILTRIFALIPKEGAFGSFNLTNTHFTTKVVVQDLSPIVSVSHCHVATSTGKFHVVNEWKGNTRSLGFRIPATMCHFATKLTADMWHSLIARRRSPSSTVFFKKNYPSLTFTTFNLSEWHSGQIKTKSGTGRRVIMYDR